MNTIYKLSNEVVLDLFEIQLDSSEGYLRFHGSKNFSSNIVFQGKEYLFIPCEISGPEKNIDGRQSRPSVKIANINNFMSKIFIDRNNLIGNKFIRKKVLAKDLDSSNFENSINPYGYSSYNTYISKDVFIIHIKKSDSKEFIEIELSSKIDLENVSMPFRKVTNDTCAWKYRCFGCNYGNTPDYAGPILKIGNSQAFASTFFDQSWGGFPNLGVPVADENNKVFLSGYHTDISKNSYNLTSLYFKGAWSPTTTYAKGEFVYIEDNQYYDAEEDDSIYKTEISSKKFFVCVEDNVLNKYPEQNTDVWKEDKCSKNLQGCLLRFKDFGVQSIISNNQYPNGPLPFGGFQGTFSYPNDKSVS